MRLEGRGEGTPVAAPAQPEGLALHRARLMCQSNGFRKSPPPKKTQSVVPGGKVRVQGLGFRVWGVGIGGCSSGFEVNCFEFGGWDLGLGLGFGI